ncbi:hypothetical protein QYM36_007097 [Artemia franciscana]|uniref:RNA-directed DNA polymerase n=1 Tax=Artemia franciscana TaxID=6661 RepID=A0AA88L8Y5_ARTSF|nr:hypothetical protein QYM36_007097 [Artemia franciscana]
MLDELTYFSIYPINPKKIKALHLNITTDYQLNLNGLPLEETVNIVGNEATNTPAFTSDLYNQEETEVFLYAINKDSSKDEIFAEISVCGQIHIDFKIDTGAQVNILPSQYLDKLSPKPKLLKATQRLTSYCGSTIPYVGVCNIPCHYKNGPTQQLTFYVVESNNTPIIGFKASKDMNLMKLVLNIEKSPVSEYSDVFKGIGKLETECEIYLKDNATPTVHPARKIPLALKQKLKTELERLESLDIIKKVSEPTDWVNAMVMVEKKDGGVRLCIDPVDLNKAIKRPYYPVPSFDDAVAELDGAAVFSRLDARSGYWMLPLSTRSSYYTTFSTIYGRYRWKRYPFGLVSAQDEFQRKMEEAFEGLEGIRILVDDILVYGKNREEHDQRLSAVLRRARKKGIRFNSEKCEFSKDKVKYFGYIISRDGIKPDPEKIRAIQDMPSPQSKEELQTLLGMLNFLSKYIPDLSSKNKPLRDLTKATDFRWETDHEASMKEIKSCISENLVFFDHKCKVVELKVDASKHGLGAELSSNGKIVGFASRALSTTEQNYSQLEKELYAIVFECKPFHHYIYGRKTIVTTDHRPLETILSRPLHTAPARLQRMMIQIQPYDIEVHYSPGSDIPVPDALSRLHLPDVDTKMQNDIEVFVHTVMKSLPVSDSKLDEIRRETEKDTQLKAVKELILKGWPGTRQSSKEQVRQKRYHDKTAKPLREPQLEDQVFIQKKTNGPWTKAKIISCHENPRSNVVETEDGSRLRRNRVHISRHSFPVAKEEIRIQPTTQDKSNDISHPILTESPQPIRKDIETSPRNVPLPREEGEPSDPPLVAPTIVPTPENAAPDCPATGTKSPTTTSKVMPHTRSSRVVRPPKRPDL